MAEKTLTSFRINKFRHFFHKEQNMKIFLINGQQIFHMNLNKYFTDQNNVLLKMICIFET